MAQPGRKSPSQPDHSIIFHLVEIDGWNCVRKFIHRLPGFWLFGDFQIWLSHLPTSILHLKYKTKMKYIIDPTWSNFFLSFFLPFQSQPVNISSIWKLSGTEAAFQVGSRREARKALLNRTGQNGGLGWIWRNRWRLRLVMASSKHSPTSFWCNVTFKTWHQRQIDYIFLLMNRE